MEKEIIELQNELLSQKFQSTVLQCPISIVMTNKIGIIEFVNTKFCDVTGYKYNEVIGKNEQLYTSGYHDDKFYRVIYNFLEKGLTWKGRIQNKKKSGELFWEDVTITPFINKDKSISYISMKQDITLLVKQEEENILLLDRLHFNLKSDSLPHNILGLSQEFHNSLNGIINLTKLISVTQDGLDNKGKKYLELLLDSVNKVETLVEKLNNIT